MINFWPLMIWQIFETWSHNKNLIKTFFHHHIFSQNILEHSWELSYSKKVNLSIIRDLVFNASVKWFKPINLVHYPICNKSKRRTIVYSGKLTYFEYSLILFEEIGIRWKSWPYVYENFLVKYILLRFLHLTSSL